MDDLSYINKKGDTVFTAHFHRKRGYCCKSDCLHCPFGTTLANHGLTFQDINRENEMVAQKILKSDEETFTGQLLMNAFGNSKKKVSLNSRNYDDFKLVFLKKTLCGVLHKGRLKIRELYLLNEFKDQGISKDIIQNAFFIHD